MALVIGLGLGFAAGWMACLLIRWRPEHERAERLRSNWIEERRERMSLRAVV